MSNKIELSPNWVLGTGGMINRLFETASGAKDTTKSTSGILSSASQTYENANSGNTCYGSVLTVMKGVKPLTSLELTPTLAVANIFNRNSDTLILYDTAYTHFSSRQTTVNPAIISTVFVPAKATGTATWFWIRSWGGHPNSGNPTVIGQSIIGSIGLIGSGADLEMTDVNILTGDSYRISAMKIEFATSWTY